VVLHAHDWLLTVVDLRALEGQLNTRGLTLSGVEGGQAATLVAASALGLTTLLQRPDSHPWADTGDVPADLFIHRGTLRSGDHLEVSGSALLLGDVNPGGRVSAAGHVLVWGRLRGVAHAGCQGDRSARIVALQLRPLQLRIADVVARGPEEPPPDGCCEQARLIDGVIRIDPAEPIWPLEF
jgi:septum site-determining protein MinC